MEDFPANSQRARQMYEAKQPQMREDEPRVERITTARTVPRKRGLGHKFKDTFVGGDARTAFEYMVLEVFVPSIQDAIIEAFQGGFERLVRGEGPRPARRGMVRGYGGPGYVDYRGQGGNAPTARRPQPPRTISRQSRARGLFDELIIASRPEAEEVLERMYDYMSRFGTVSVAHLYELTGVQSSHTDMKWGWAELRGSRVVPQRNGGGYLLDLPEPQPIDG